MLRNSIIAIVAVLSGVACRQAGDDVDRSPGHATMTLICSADGNLDFQLSSWSITLPSPKGAFTVTNSHLSNTDGVIAAQNAAYPFGGRTFKAAHGTAIVATPIAGTDAGTYKYLITVVCPSPAGPKTTVIDPDMIIPWKISAS
jgi:hypothetical protein